VLRREGDILVEVGGLLKYFEVKAIRIGEPITFENYKVKKVNTFFADLASEYNNPFVKPVKDIHEETAETLAYDEENVIYISLVKEKMSPGTSKDFLKAIKKQISKGGGKRRAHSSTFDLQVKTVMITEHVKFENEEHANTENRDSRG